MSESARALIPATSTSTTVTLHQDNSFIEGTSFSRNNHHPGSSLKGATIKSLYSAGFQSKQPSSNSISWVALPEPSVGGGTGH